MGLTIILPTYNENWNISFVIKNIQKTFEKTDIEYQIIIVDDNSVDWTKQEVTEISQKFSNILLFNRNSKGLASAIYYWIQKASFNKICVMDADGQHPPEKIPFFYNKIKDEKNNIIIWSRFIKGGIISKSWKLYRKINSFLAILAVKPLIKWVKDPMSWFFLIDKRILDWINLNLIWYKFLLEIIVKIEWLNIIEMPIEFSERIRGVSKLNFKEIIKYWILVSILYFLKFIQVLKKIVLFLKFIIKKTQYFLIVLIFSLWIIKFNIKLFFRKKVKPYKTTFKINNFCNLKCKICNIRKNSPWEENTLKIDDFKKIVTGYKDDIKFVTVTWWEPFLLSNLEEYLDFLITECKKLKVLSINTNWYFYKKIQEILEKISLKSKNIIITVNISIDGNEELHNSMRGDSNSYINAQKSIKFIKNLSSKNPFIKINKETVLVEDNSKLWDLFLSDKERIVDIPHNWYFYCNSKEQNMSPKFIKNINIKNIKWFFKKRYLKSYLKNNFSKKYWCFAMKASVFVDTNLDVKPCISWDKTVWNLKKKSLNSIISSNEYTKISEKIAKGKCPICWTPCEAYISIMHLFYKK